MAIRIPLALPLGELSAQQTERAMSAPMVVIYPPFAIVTCPPPLKLGDF